MVAVLNFCLVKHMKAARSSTRGGGKGQTTNEKDFFEALKNKNINIIKEYFTPI